MSLFSIFIRFWQFREEGRGGSRGEVRSILTNGYYVSTLPIGTFNQQKKTPIRSGHLPFGNLLFRFLGDGLMGNARRILYTNRHVPLLLLCAA